MRANALSILALPFLPALSSAYSLDCAKIIVDKKHFDFSKLGGPHSLMISDDTRPPAVHNTTFTVDICQPLKKVKILPNADQCEAGTNVCAIVKSYNPIDGTEPEIDSVIPIAGNYETSSGRALDPKYSRLKTTDADSEGLRVELHGGKYGGRTQSAVIEFQCDHTRTGNEGFEDADEGAVEERARKLQQRKNLGLREAEDDADDTKEDKRSLSYVSYGPSDEKSDVLRVNWLTKYACEDVADGDDGKDGSDGDGEDKEESGKHWGFFTWFILITFLGIAAYLIFGSWLNYNRYGARGWDLLPHGDTIRDLPYLFKDWSRKVVSTVSGGGSRGGYSAV